MRILASNPDTLADLVPRQMLFATLTAAGHELMLLCAADARPLVPVMAPAARACYLPQDADGPQRTDAWQPVVATVRAFQPDLWLLAGGPSSALDSQLASYWPDVPVIGRLQQDSSPRRAEHERTDQGLKAREDAVRLREEQIASREFDLKAHYGAQLLALQSEVRRAEAREKDLQAKLEQLQHEQASLMKVCHDLRGELRSLQGHAHELAGSRWRRIGMKIGIAKPTTWEQLHANGN